MITPKQGYKIDPTNPNQVIRDPSVINSDLLSTSNPLNVQEPPQVPQSDVKNIPITIPPTPPVPTPTTSPLITEIETMTNKLLGKDIATEQKTASMTADYQKSLNELNTQIKMHQANALARQEEALKSGETLRYSTGLAGQVARTDAIEAMKLSALAQGMQGNILLATKQAESAVNAEFSQTEKDLATKRQNILNNYDTFTEAEKKRADAALLALNEKDAFVARSKADREQAYKTAVEAAKNGLTDTSLLTKIQNSTPEKALELAAPFMKEKEKPILQTFERNGHNIRQTLDPMTGNVISETDLGAKEKAKTPGTKLSSNAQAVVDNPNLLNSYTNTVKGQVIAELQQAGYDTSNLGVKPLSDTAIKEINQTETALDNLQSLRNVINENLAYVGPISGLAKYNPYSKARQVQAEVDRVKQMVGKALEGGVLRKEDEEKYKKILATITDTPQTALYKIDSLISTLQRDTENYKNLQIESGRTLDIKKGLSKKGVEIKIEDLRTKYNY